MKRQDAHTGEVRNPAFGSTFGRLTLYSSAHVAKTKVSVSSSHHPVGGRQ